MHVYMYYDVGGTCCTGPARGRKKKGGYVPIRAVEIALKQARRFLRAQQHDDIDQAFDVSSSCIQPCLISCKHDLFQ